MNQINKWRELLLGTILLVGAIALTFYPIIYFFQKQYIFALVELGCALSIWIALYFVKVHHQYYWPAVVGWCGIQFILTLLLFSGGVAGTGLIWWSLLPINSIVLFGNRQGVRWLCFGLVIFLVTNILGAIGIIQTYFTFTQTSLTLSLMAIISLIIFNFEKVSDLVRVEIEEKSKQLEDQININKKNQAALTDNFKSLAEKSLKKENTEKAMINLLEDSRELELQLKEQKDGIELLVKQRTRELSDTKAKLDASIENLPLGFLMTDIKEQLVITNSLAIEILGYPNNNANLNELKTILKPKIDLGQYIKDCGTHQQRQTISDIEMAGHFFRFLLSPILSKESKTACLGVVVLIQDITEDKVLERSKDEFFSIASHELRTPLTAIRGNTSMILEHYQEQIKDPELNSMITDIHDSSVRLIEIVNDFLNISRLEQGRMEFAKETIDLADTINSVIKEFEVTGSRSNIGIESQISTKPPTVIGDIGKVKQVLINLIGNALKFTTKGKIIINAEIGDKSVKVLVTDNGRGISIKQQSLLFRKFQQAGASLFTRDTAGGTGLGLYISKKMIEGMGGEIKLEKSEEGVGSTFSFTLPLA